MTIESQIVFRGGVLRIESWHKVAASETPFACPFLPTSASHKPTDPNAARDPQKWGADGHCALCMLSVHILWQQDVPPAVVKDP